jgi:hypothetical protein
VAAAVSSLAAALQDQALLLLVHCLERTQPAVSSLVLVLVTVPLQLVAHRVVRQRVVTVLSVTLACRACHPGDLES